MTLLDKVKTELEKAKGYDFSAITDKELVHLYNAVYAAETVIERERVQAKMEAKNASIEANPFADMFESIARITKESKFNENGQV